MDPNEKHAVPASGLKFEQDSIINYTINFQNTGTASTHFVIVKDTLDQNLDPKTVIATGSSHPFKLDVNGRILTFTFDPVELTDSATDEPHSHGSISFMAKLKPNLPIGTVIRNFASIYFDYNTPVLTNTTVNTIVNPAGIQTAQIDNLRVTVTPNPFSTITTISFNNTAHDKFSFALYDIEGKVVRTLETNDATIELNRAALESGAYMYKLTNQRTAERIAGKIVIM
jgi:fimbrial isopeptide formation D2 family protein